MTCIVEHRSNSLPAELIGYRLAQYNYEQTQGHLHVQAAALASRFASGGVQLPRGGLQNGQQQAAPTAVAAASISSSGVPSEPHRASGQVQPRAAQAGHAARGAVPAEDATDFLSSLELLPPPPPLVR